MIRGWIVGLAMLASSTAVHAQYSTVYVFGDSLSDRGRIPELLTPPSFLAPWPKPPYFGGRFTNGPTWAELLPGLIGVAPNPGQNFAVGGALTNTTNGANGTIVDPHSILPGVRTEINSFVGSGGQFQPSSVVIQEGGANDYFKFLDATPTPTIGQVPAAVAGVAANMVSNIEVLVASGARTLLVPNLPNLGVSPAYRAGAEAGLATAVSAQNAAALNTQLGMLSGHGVNIFVVDWFTGFQFVLAHPGLFGFTNVTDPCERRRVAAVPAYLIPGPQCSNPNQYLFWDDVHPTEAGHQILAEYAADTLMAPQTVGAQAAFSLTNGDNFLRRMQEPILSIGLPGLSAPILKDAFVGGGGNVFLNVQRTSGNGSSTQNSFGFDYGVTQVSGGVVVRPSNYVRLGLIAGYDDGSANPWNGSIQLKSARIGAMGGFDNGTLYAGAGVAFSLDDYDLNRQTYVPQLQSSADTHGYTASAFGAAGYWFNFGWVSAGPLVALRYTNVHISEYNESGAPGLDMIVQAQHADQLIGSAGIAIAKRFYMGVTTLSPFVSLAAEKDLHPDDRFIATALVTVPDVVRVQEIDPDNKVFGRVTGGIALALPSGAVGILPGGATGTLRGETTFGRSAGSGNPIFGGSGGNEHAIFGTITVPLYPVSRPPTRPSRKSASLQAERS
jgi:outer membrane lipase/esterase